MDTPKIEDRPINTVKANPDNPRTITGKAFKRLVESLRDAPGLFEARPLLCSDRTGELIVLGGNMRLEAARELKYEQVPCIVMKGLTEADEREIAIKDNGSFGEWDFDMLASWDDLPLNDWGVEIPEVWLESLDDKLPDAGSGEEKTTETTCPKCGFTYAI